MLRLVCASGDPRDFGSGRLTERRFLYRPYVSWIKEIEVSQPLEREEITGSSFARRDQAYMTKL